MESELKDLASQKQTKNVEWKRELGHKLRLAYFWH
jgi:hypothetical protein